MGRLRRKRPIYDAAPIGTAEEHQARCQCAECAKQDRHEKWGYWQMMLFPLKQQRAPTMPANPCAVDGCEVSAKPGQLMCRAHWYATPAPLRVAVNRTWRKYREDPEAYLKARGAAINHHREQADPEAQAEMF